MMTMTKYDCLANTRTANAAADFEWATDAAADAARGIADCSRQMVKVNG